MMFKWGIIGYGGMGKNFAKDLMAEHKLAAIYVRTPKLQQTQALHKDDSINIYDDLSAFFASDIDIVYIAAANQVHYQFIEQALMANKHVLCEKAILGSYKEFAYLQNLAATKKLILAEAMTIYHMPLYKKIDAIIAAGTIGKIKHLAAHFGSNMPYDPNNRFFNKELGGGVMLDIGTYALSFLQYFSNTPLELLYKDVVFGETGVDVKVYATLKTATHDAMTDLSFLSKYPKVAFISGEKGYIEIHDYPRAQKATLWVNYETTTIEAGKTIDALKYEIHSMEEAIRKEDSSVMYLNKTAAVVQIIDEIIS